MILVSCLFLRISPLKNARRFFVISTTLAILLREFGETSIFSIFRVIVRKKREREREEEEENDPRLNVTLVPTIDVSKNQIGTSNSITLLFD